MRKRVFALLLSLCLLGALQAAPVSAAAEDSAAVRTVRSLGIITGDGSGNMDLGSDVTRAQFAKMLVAASSYRDTVSPDGTGYSLYRDVKSSHWASEYIRLAAQEGWMTGYTDGTFRPDSTITLEEACSSALHLLGYSASSLAGSFPYAQLSKANALGLRDGISRTQGQRMTRGDCALLFYNLLTAQNASGQTYGATLGYTVTNGEVDYASVMLDNVSGPYVASFGEKLPFVPATVYRDGKSSALTALDENDVYYYSEGLGTAWIYTKRASGKLESVSAGGGTPTSVTVAGKTYSVGGADAAYLLSSLAGTETGNYVTLLLGMGDAVVGALTGKNVNGTYYGVVKFWTRGSSAGADEVTTDVSVFCTDGVTRTFSFPRDVGFGAGNVVMVTVTDDGETIKTVSARLDGKVSGDATRIGDDTLAGNVRIIDVGDSGAAVTVEPERIANVTLGERDVRFYSLNTAGEIDHLILNDVTGDTWTYAYLTSISDTSNEKSVSIGYTWLLNGSSQSQKSGNAKYPVRGGGVALVYESDGTTLRSMRQMDSVRLTDLNADASSARADNKAYRIADGVQVYLRQNGVYYQADLNSVSTDDYKLTGWYDTFTGSAGGAIRIVIAEPYETE